MTSESPTEAAEIDGDGPEPATLTEAVENMLTALLHSRKHDVLILLAREYARAIDEGDEETLAKLGHRLESVCVRLGVKPARLAGGEHGDGVSALDAWRARRA